MVIAACAWAAVAVPVPDWARWALGGTAVAVAVGGMLAALMGPAARRLAGEGAPLSVEERKALTVAERIEMVSNARHILLQAATGLVVVGGLVFTGAGLVYTSRTLAVSEQGQITDRYTKAAEQLGSDKRDVRLAGIYALQRLATDSPRDRDTIRNVLAAFVRGRDACTPAAGKTTLPTQCTIAHEKLRTIPSIRPEADVFAALTIAPALANHDASITSQADFSHVRFPRANLFRANLSGADLRGADLSGADMAEAGLRDAALVGAKLRDARLIGADLSDAYLNGADLRGANLHGAVLNGTSLYGADLRGADLSGADLRNPDLGVTDMHMTERYVREVAIVDRSTKFH
ncbi:hypothetical protein HD597_005348 [Nonomuraea thailandensis]|uniref:Pentapeptide repeat-containing protein n=1 Tax=Nonomuraea thailandensis TaxID=1188745 RepID=A0A9X2K2T3_9ACTN|nr:pentapeptide repeat-containing protein [Nonomuraea thailandensis]MCP2358328.1 hypothetical protein [Nonomuraea thailandensis]